MEQFLKEEFAMISDVRDNVKKPTDTLSIEDKTK